jgi:hypothetical protein
VSVTDVNGFRTGAQMRDTGGVVAAREGDLEHAVELYPQEWLGDRLRLFRNSACSRSGARPGEILGPPCSYLADAG